MEFGLGRDFPTNPLDFHGTEHKCTNKCVHYLHLSSFNVFNGLFENGFVMCQNTSCVMPATLSLIGEIVVLYKENNVRYAMLSFSYKYNEYVKNNKVIDGC